MDIRIVNLEEKFSGFQDFWNPRIVGELNNQQVKIARLKGEFIVHHHENEDEMFLVIEGKLLMELEDKTLELNPGEFVIIPRGIQHKPKCVGEVKVLLFEPASTLNTGNEVNDLTIRDPRKI